MIVPGTDPILADASAARLLSGLSGAHVYLLTRDGRHWFVRKAAADAGGSERLRLQARKQSEWNERAASVLRTPRIVEEGEVEGRYFFDMDVVRGVDGVTYLRTADYAGVRHFSDSVCRYVTEAAAAAPLCPTASTDFFSALFSRVCSVQAATDLVAPTDLATVFLGLERIRSREVTAPTWCHGDLTLENLFVDEAGVIWAFDLLDAPFEHYWQDVAKLHQDLEGGWYLRSRPPIARCVTEFVGRKLNETAVGLNPAYADVHPVLMAATFIRILPYVRDEASAQFVRERVAHYAAALRGEQTT